MTTRLLAVGDIHLGRRPRRLPEALASAISPHELSPAAGWRRAVDYALARRVDALLLAGDVVDRDDDFFESYGLLEQGIRRLAEAGIPTVGVAGNHDVQVLPRLARAIPGFTLLGADGTWEGCRIGGGGHTPDTLDGSRPIGYLGSLVGLDPTETGPRGPWLVEVGPGGA